MEQCDEKIDAERDGDGEAKQGFHDALLHPLGCGGVQHHQGEECEAQRNIKNVQHGHLLAEWSDTELEPRV